MSDEPTKNPRGVSPNTSSGISELTFSEPSKTLIEGLGPLADSVRQIGVNLGARPYQMRSIRLRWTGGAIGRGEQIVVFDEPLVPTPKVNNISSIERMSTNAGSSETGDVRVTQISPMYTEDEIKRYFSLDLRPDEEGFIEVRVDRRDGITERKRYVVAKVPERKADRFEWVVTLRKQDQDRPRRV